MTDRDRMPDAASPLLDDDEAETPVWEMLLPLLERWRLLVFGPLLAGVLAVGVTYVVKPVYTARTSFLMPQQQQNAAAAALGQLGALAGLAGGAAGIKSPADQFVSLLQSENVASRIIDRFDLMAVYDADFRWQARKTLNDRVRIAAGKKDGMIGVEVDDHQPRRAADMANQYVDELRRLSNELALTEAKERRLFFEARLGKTRDELTRAQQALQASGFNPGALRAEPRAAAERYARLQAEVTAAEVRLQTLRRSLAEPAIEVQQQLTMLGALRNELAKAEAPADPTGGPDYITKFREYKYQETLFEVFSRQYELARLDESREGALIQVVDVALPPERRSWPKRALTGIGATLAAFVVLVLFLFVQQSWRRYAADPASAATRARLRAAFGRA